MLSFDSVVIATLRDMEIAVIRRKNLNLLLAQNKQQRGGTQKAWAARVGVVPDHVTQMKNGHRDMGGDVARRIESRLRIDVGWMDVEHDTIDSVTVKPSLQFVTISGHMDYAGQRIANNKINEHMESVKAEWLVQRGLKEDCLFSKYVEAKNMRPSFLESDVVIINTEWGGELKNDVTYAFGKIGEKLTLHRVLRRVSGGITLSNDNRDYADETVDESDIASLDVAGEVVRLVRDV